MSFYESLMDRNRTGRQSPRFARSPKLVEQRNLLVRHSLPPLSSVCTTASAHIGARPRGALRLCSASCPVADPVSRAMRVAYDDGKRVKAIQSVLLRLGNQSGRVGSMRHSCLTRSHARLNRKRLMREISTRETSRPTFSTLEGPPPEVAMLLALRPSPILHPSEKRD